LGYDIKCNLLFHNNNFWCDDNSVIQSIFNIFNNSSFGTFSLIKGLNPVGNTTGFLNFSNSNEKIGADLSKVKEYFTRIFCTPRR
jgi:hypothetical protein